VRKWLISEDDLRAALRGNGLAVLISDEKQIEDEFITMVAMRWQKYERDECGCPKGSGACQLCR
jgi:hypothetical protein